jgi:hypothetical protein
MIKVVLGMLCLMSFNAFSAESTYECLSEKNQKLFSHGDSSSIYVTVNAWKADKFVHFEQYQDELPFHLKPTSSNRGEVVQSRATKFAGATVGMGAEISDALLNNENIGGFTLFNDELSQDYVCTKL